jgi:DUF1680 family protein
MIKVDLTRGFAAALLSAFFVSSTTAAEKEEEAPPSSRRSLAPGAELGPHPLVLIPYYAWAHRGEGEMAVWLFKSGTQYQFPN